MTLPRYAIHRLLGLDRDRTAGRQHHAPGRGARAGTRRLAGRVRATSPASGHPRGATVAGVPRPAGSPGQLLTIDEDQATATVTVALSGELDLTDVPFLAQHLAPVLCAPPAQLIFDLARVSFIDCAVARLIVGAGSWPTSGRSVIRCAGPAVRIVLTLTGLDARCHVEP